VLRSGDEDEDAAEDEEDDCVCACACFPSRASFCLQRSRRLCTKLLQAEGEVGRCKGVDSFQTRREMTGRSGDSQSSMADSGEHESGLDEVTPARTFFVRMVAQRELEVNEEEWFQVLQRQGVVCTSTSRTTRTTMNTTTSRSSHGGRRSASSSAGGAVWRTVTSNSQILKIPLKQNVGPEYADEEEARPSRRESQTALERQGGFRKEDEGTRYIPKGFRIPIIHVMSPFSMYYAIWQYFMMFIDFTYTAFWVPYSVVFVLEDCEWNRTSAVLDFVVGWLYVADILINLRVGYAVVYKLSRTLELGSWRAAVFYVVNGTFLVDLPATIPVFIQTICLGIDGAETNFGINLTQIMRLLRLLRLARALRLLLSDALDVARVGVKRVTGAKMVWFQSMQVIILFAWTAHLMACAWYYTAVIEDAATFNRFPHREGRLWSCVEGMEAEAADTWLKRTGLLCAPNAQKYCAAFYFATMTITTVGYGDISADTNAERGVAIVMMFLGALFFGYIVSTTTLFLEKYSVQKKEVQEYLDKIDVVDAWAKNRKIPRSLNLKIRSYYQVVWSKAEELQCEKNILMELPFPLRAAAAEHITMPLWEHVTCLSYMDRKHWQHISSRLRAEWFPPGDFIANAPGHGTGVGLRQYVDSLWVLERGKIVCVRDGEEFMYITGPQVFGCSLVLKLLDSSFPLETDYVAFMSTTPVWLWRINKEYLQRYLQRNKDALAQFVQGIIFDPVQADLLEIDFETERKFYDILLELKGDVKGKGSGEVEPAADSDDGNLRRGVSRAGISTIEENGKWIKALF